MNNTEHMDDTEHVNTAKVTNEEIDMENIRGGMKIVKVRNVTTKLVEDIEYTVVLDDEEVNDMVKDLMSEDLVDKDGNKHQPNGTSCANTVIRTIDGHLDKFREAIKNIPKEKLQEMKEQARYAIQKDPFLYASLNNVGIDLDNFENYLGSVEVLTVERRRVYNVYEIKTDSKATK